jgi:hypothetical protein
MHLIHARLQSTYRTTGVLLLALYRVKQLLNAGQSVAQAVDCVDRLCWEAGLFAALDVLYALVLGLEMLLLSLVVLLGVLAQIAQLHVNVRDQVRHALQTIVQVGELVVLFGDGVRVHIGEDFGGTGKVDVVVIASMVSLVSGKVLCYMAICEVILLLVVCGWRWFVASARNLELEDLEGVGNIGCGRTDAELVS